MQDAITGGERRIMLHQPPPEAVFERLLVPERGEGGRSVTNVGAQVFRHPRRIDTASANAGSHSAASIS